MRIDITYPLGEKDFKALAALMPNDKAFTQTDLLGHVGTHLDLMGKNYPDDCYTASGRLFDVRNVAGRDIDIRDIDFQRSVKGNSSFSTPAAWPLSRMVQRRMYLRPYSCHGDCYMPWQRKKLP